MTKRIALVLVLIGLPGLPGAQTAPALGERLPLDTAVRLALAHNRQVQSARLETASADDAILSARSRRLPAFSIEGSASQLLSLVSFSFPRVAQQVALKADALEVQFRMAQEQLTQTTALNTLASQKEQMNQLLGRDVRTPFEVESLAAASVLDVDLPTAQQRALDRRPDVRRARRLRRLRSTGRQRRRAAGAARHGAARRGLRGQAALLGRRVTRLRQDADRVRAEAAAQTLVGRGFSRAAEETTT